MLDKEGNAMLRAALKEPYPRNLFLTLAMDKVLRVEIPTDNITEDMIAGLDYAISTLPPRDQDIVRMRYVEKMTYVAIGKRFDVTSERIRTLEHRSIVKLHRPPLIGYIKYGKNGYEKQLAKAKEEKTRAYKEDKYQLKIHELDLSVRPHNRLIAAGFEIVKDFASLTEDEIVNIKYLGKKSIVEIAIKLNQIGIQNTAWEAFLPQKKEK